MTNTTNFTINIGSTCYKLMGFSASTLYTSTSNSLTFPFGADFSGIKRISIKSSILSSKNYDTLTGYNNTIATIATNASAGGIIYFLNQSNFNVILSNLSIDYIDIQITDEYNNLINFNGIDLFISLQLDIYKDIQIYDHNLNNLI